MGEEELNMDLFGSDDIELNLDEEIKSTEDTVEEQETEDPVDPQEDNPGEDSNEDPETVAEGEENQEEEEESTDDDSESDETTSPSLYSSLATHLYEKGLISSLDSNIKIESLDDVNSLIEKEVETRIEQKYSPEEIEAWKAKQNGVDPDEFTNYQNIKKELDSITNDTIENNTELRKKLIYKDYINQGLSEEKALKLLNRSVELDEDLDDAVEALENIRKFEETKFQKLQEELKVKKAQEQAEYEAQQQKLKDSVYNAKEIIDGISLTKTMKDKVYNSMTKIVGNSPQGIPENNLMKARRENPIEFDTKLYYLYELTKGFSDFSIINKKEKSRASKEIEDAIRNTNFIKDVGNPSYLQDANSYDGIGSELVID